MILMRSPSSSSVSSGWTSRAGASTPECRSETTLTATGSPFLNAERLGDRAEPGGHGDSPWPEAVQPSFRSKASLDEAKQNICSHVRALFHIALLAISRAVTNPILEGWRPSGGHRVPAQPALNLHRTCTRAALKLH